MERFFSPRLQKGLPPVCLRFASMLAMIGGLGFVGVQSVQCANILIVTGTTGFAITAGNVLNADLGGTNTVTVSVAVPGSLAGFTQIYDTRYDNTPNFSVGEMNQYLAFLNASPGNAIFMMGENASFNARNGPILQFVALAGGGTIAVPALTSAASETVSPLFRTPNNISTIAYAACGLVSSQGSGAFASSESGGGCSLFFGTGGLLNAPQGALVIVFDVNFILTAPSVGSAVNEVAFRQNLEQFVSAPPVAPPPLNLPISTPSLSQWGMALLGCGLIYVAARRMRVHGGVA